jgi:hypothetical protein
MLGSSGLVGLEMSPAAVGQRAAAGARDDGEAEHEILKEQR